MTNKTITIEVPEGADVLINGKPYNAGGGLRKPKVGEAYWLSGCCEVTSNIWVDDYVDNGSWSIGNCFPTKAKAEARLRDLKTTQRLKEIAAEGPAVDWGDSDSGKYHVYYHYQAGLIRVGADTYVQDQGTIYFPTIKLAQKAIDELGDDLVKLIKGEE